MLDAVVPLGPEKRSLDPDGGVCRRPQVSGWAVCE